MFWNQHNQPPLSENIKPFQAWVFLYSKIKDRQAKIQNIFGICLELFYLDYYNICIY